MPQARYLEPGFFLRRIADPLVMQFGLASTLGVRGRRSGKLRRVPVNVLKLDGERYLLAPRGETEWVRNLRAAGEGELRRRGRTEGFRAVELPDEEKPRLVQAYLDRWGSQVKSQFERLPDPADHPVFRIEPLES